MKFKSVSGHEFIVKDLDKSVAFYEQLGFVTKKRDDNHAMVYLNWYWIDFVVGKPDSNPTISSYLSVDNVEETYNEMVELGIKPDSEPENIGMNRQFSFSDPDGYKLVVFKRR